MALTKVGKEGITGISNSSDATAITIDSSERINIGTGTPPTADSVLTVQKSSAANEFNVISSPSHASVVNLGDTDDYNICRIKADNSDNSLQFQTNNTEKMRIKSDGNVGIGDSATDPNFKLQVRSDNTGSEGVTDLRSNSSSFTGNVLLVGSNTSTTNSTYNHMRADAHGVSQRFAIRDSGNVVNANNQYGSISDERLKENIVDANSQWNDIKALKIRRYNRIGEEQKEIGVIAQELEASNMSGLVEDGPYYDVKNNSNEETRKTVKYSILYMKAVKALQEAITRIETLEAEVKALKG